MARKAIEVDEKKIAKVGKQEIKALPSIFTSEEDFRRYIALADLLKSDKSADKANTTLTANKLLTVKQSIANYKANGIELEKEFYPIGVNVGGVFCGIHRKQRVIFACGFVGDRKLAFTISTRANKELPELLANEKIADKYGYATKYLTRLDANNSTLLPASIDFNHYCEMNFGLPFCYTTSKTDLLDFAQWLNDEKAYDRYKTAAAEFENINYYDENCISEFCKVAKENGFEIFRQDVMKVASDYAKYLQSVIDGDFTQSQKEKAFKMLHGEKVKTEKTEDKKTA